MSARVDLTGQRFGRLTVTHYVGSNRHRHSLWECVCDCGNVVIVSTLCLRRPKGTKSCGCLQPGITVDEHGKVNRLYHIWCGMKQRCFDIKCKDYPNYGGRGIKINQEWMEFKALYAWAKESGYQNNLTIERINNDGDYEPDNCTWIPSEKQARNRRSNHYLDFNGQNKTIIEWSEILNVDRGAIEQRLRRGWSIEKTLTTPIKSREAV